MQKAFLMAAAATLEAHRQQPDHAASLSLARKMLDHCKAAMAAMAGLPAAQPAAEGPMQVTLCMQARAALHRSGPSGMLSCVVGSLASQRGSPIGWAAGLLYVLVTKAGPQDFDLATRLNDEAGQLAALQRCQALPQVTPEHLCRLAGLAVAAAGTGGASAAAKTALAAALRLMLAKSPPAYTEVAQVRPVVLWEVCEGTSGRADWCLATLKPTIYASHGRPCGSWWSCAGKMTSGSACLRRQPR